MKDFPKNERLTCEKICKTVNELHNTNVSYRTLQNRVYKGLVGPPRIGRGKQPTLPPDVEKELQFAIASFVKLSCANMISKPNRKDIISRLKVCLVAGGSEIKRFDHLYDRISRSISTEISVTVADSKLEERRAAWCTYLNINTWFDELSKTLVEKGFARPITPADKLLGHEGELFFHPNQLERIINLDETEFSTDGTSKNSGGRSVTKYGPGTGGLIPAGCDRTNKSGYSATFIAGSNVAGWPLPGHLQMKSDAKNENKKIDKKLFLHAMLLSGVLENDELIERDITVNCNEKSGMDNEEFSKYIQTLIMPLFPDACDIAGKRVIIIVDSGPGRLNADLLAILRLNGFYMIAGVPNTTHVTQSTDRNYGLFKSDYRHNLQFLTISRREMNKTVKPSDIPLLIFGGHGIEKLPKNCFETAFGKKKNQEVWKEIGIYPFNRNCLLNNKVMHHVVYLPDGAIDIDADPATMELLAVEKANKNAVLFLDSMGYNGSVFSCKAPKAKSNQIVVTSRGSREMQDLLASATSAGPRFIATGGAPLNSSDMIISHERTVRTDRKKILLQKEKKWESAKKTADNAIAAIARFKVAKKMDAMDISDCKFLTAKDLRLFYQWKYCKNPPVGMKKDELLAAWLKEKDNEPVNVLEWRRVDYTELESIDTEYIALRDTEVSRKAKAVLYGSVASLVHVSASDILNLPAEERALLKAKL